jgi:hypothetical protein
MCSTTDVTATKLLEQDVGVITSNHYEAACYETSLGIVLIILKRQLSMCTFNL